jgi:hypothetical protein
MEVREESSTRSNTILIKPKLNKILANKSLNEDSNYNLTYTK